MDERETHMKRRQILARGVGLVGACVVGVATAVHNAVAAKSSKASLLYQDRPRDGKRCSDCKFFSADSSDTNTGTCALVEGAIDRNGWCMTFSPRT